MKKKLSVALFLIYGSVMCNAVNNFLLNNYWFSAIFHLLNCTINDDVDVDAMLCHHH